jgi:phospholipid/cholesterol/gamma-HCH transport system substrate-binding protein
MEIRANYFLVGLFTLLAFLGAGGFILWIDSKDKGIAMTDYDISFTESVKGLSVNNDVLFSGIRVGKVAQITISRVTPGEVKVRVSIAADTPVRENSVAQLELRGITGNSIISISGGTAESPLLQVPENSVGIIRYEPSPLASVVARMPDVVASASQVLQRLDAMLSNENIQRVSHILASIEKVSATLGDKSAVIGGVITKSGELSENLDQLLLDANKILHSDVTSASKNFNSLARRADSTLGVMEPGLKQFSTQGLSDMRILVMEMRNMVHILTRVGQKLESDPRRFLFGDPVMEYQNR